MKWINDEMNQWWNESMMKWINELRREHVSVTSVWVNAYFDFGPQSIILSTKTINRCFKCCNRGCGCLELWRWGEVRWGDQWNQGSPNTQGLYLSGALLCSASSLTHLSLSSHQIFTYYTTGYSSWMHAFKHKREILRIFHWSDSRVRACLQCSQGLCVCRAVLLSIHFQFLISRFRPHALLFPP